MRGGSGGGGDAFKRFAQLLDRARRVTILTGAGVSAESAVPAFRGSDLWRRYEPSMLATPQAFARDPALVWVRRERERGGEGRLGDRR